MTLRANIKATPQNVIHSSAVRTNKSDINSQRSTEFNYKHSGTKIKERPKYRKRNDLLMI